MDSDPANDEQIPMATRRGPRPGQLTEGWRWVLAVSWSLIIPALLTLADAANTFGRPTWWLSSQATAAWWSPLPFLAPVVVAGAATANWRRWPIAGAVGVVGLGLTTVFDWSRSPSVAHGEAALTVAGLASVLACLAGRWRTGAADPEPA
jgi:hypothetical protein